MANTAKEWSTEAKDHHGALSNLRADIKEKLHHAGDELKDEWKTLEPQVEKLEHDLDLAANDAATATRAAVDDIVKRLQKLRSKLS